MLIEASSEAMKKSRILIIQSEEWKESKKKRLAYIQPTKSTWILIITIIIIWFYSLRYSFAISVWKYT